MSRKLETPWVKFGDSLKKKKDNDFRTCRFLSLISIYASLGKTAKQLKAYR